MSRPDPKKNITTLVKAFGENKTLRGLANLVLIMVRLMQASFAFALCTCSGSAAGCYSALQVLPRLVPAL